jgi:hypothetical protein
VLLTSKTLKVTFAQYVADPLDDKTSPGLPKDPLALKPTVTVEFPNTTLF